MSAITNDIRAVAAVPATPPPNLEQRYDEVVAYLLGYQRLMSDSAMRMQRESLKSPRVYARHTWRLLRDGWNANYLSGKNQEWIKGTILECATEEERGGEYFRVAVSDYPTDTLSECLRKLFPDADFEKLKKVHDQRRVIMSRLNPLQVIGYVLTAATLVLKSVPKGVIGEESYPEFERWVFWVTVVVMGYLFVCLLLPWAKLLKAKMRHQYVGDILEYTAIKYAD